MPASYFTFEQKVSVLLDKVEKSEERELTQQGDNLAVVHQGKRFSDKPSVK